MEKNVQAYIVQANIDKFHLMLQTETDPDKRAVVTRLLAEEEKKQNAAKLEAKVDPRSISVGAR